MSASGVVGSGVPTVLIRGTPYPLLLPRLSDPRLHLAAVIVSLQVLGQVAFEFRLSIAQILVALLTCAVLEVAIAFRRQRVIMWPASALLTGNGVAFILRVPGTEHGDWWSLHGAWIFAGTAAVALLSKYLIRVRGRHVFNPSNIGLVLCFLLLGPERADPLAFWWGPLSGWLVLALAIIVAGGLAILTRLRLLAIAVWFWLAFAAALALVALGGHAMTASWHLGPITGAEFWRVLVFSPEILVFLFFMITDPKTVPAGPTGRRAYAVAVGLLAALLIAPQTTEFGAKVAVLAALALVCAARPLVELAADRGVSARLARHVSGRRRAPIAALALAAAGFAGALVLAGIPARPDSAAASAPVLDADRLPDVTVVAASGVASELDRPTALRVARDLIADLRVEAEALRRRDERRAATAATGARLAELWRSIRAAGRPVAVPEYEVATMRLSLEAGENQGPPTIVATLTGTISFTTYAGSPEVVTARSDPSRFEQTVELAAERGRFLIARTRGTSQLKASVLAGRARGTGSASFAGVALTNVAASVGLGFRHGAFRYGVSTDPAAMMGGGVCWLDYDDDGWLDLFAVNSFSEADRARWESRGGLPRSALFHNVRGRFENVSSGSGADLPVRGNGCVAADFNLDGRTDVYVTTAGYSPETDGYDALLWNNGDGTFTEAARAAGINTPGWHAGAAVGDVNGDGWPDLFVSGYTDVNARVPDSSGGFPTNHLGVPDRLYLNEGLDRRGRSTFRDVAKQVGLDAAGRDHGLGAVLADLTGDRRLDLYLANDADPNRLYVNVPWPGGRKADPAGLGFRLEERGRREGVADEKAGMGIAAADFSGDGRTDLFVSNSHRQLHGVFGSRSAGGLGPAFTDARADFALAFDTRLAGWGASWSDLDLDGDLDLALANGAIPVTSLAKDVEPTQVFANPGKGSRHFADVSRVVGLLVGPSGIGRGLAAADFDNDGRVDIAVSSIGGRLVLLRNSGPPRRWLEVRLRRFVPGTVVTAVLADGRRLVRSVLAGSSYLSSEDPRVHFGLGAVRTVRSLVVSFPGGGETRLANVATNRIVTVGPKRR
jgi:Na+-translocating ferredoxin:NAD+ oxidoreductase RnfD subunit